MVSREGVLVRDRKLETMRRVGVGVGTTATGDMAITRSKI